MPRFSPWFRKKFVSLQLEMKHVAQLSIWISLLVITLMSGGIHYISCACKHKVYINQEDICCHKDSKCMVEYNIPVPDGYGVDNLEIDQVQQPLAMALYANPIGLLHQTHSQTGGERLNLQNKPPSPPPCPLPLRI